MYANPWSMCELHVPLRFHTTNGADSSCEPLLFSARLLAVQLFSFSHKECVSRSIELLHVAAWVPFWLSWMQGHVSPLFCQDFPVQDVSGSAELQSDMCRMNHVLCKHWQTCWSYAPFRPSFSMLVVLLLFKMPNPTVYLSWLYSWPLHLGCLH